MAKRIHFEDDIFYIRSRIRIVGDALMLDLDPDFFLTKLMDDFVFIDATLERLLRDLLSNERLIERKGQLLNLAEAEENFGALAISVYSQKGAMAEAFAPFSERFSEFRTRSMRRRAEIDGVTSFGGENEDNETVVSSVELNELLRGID